MKMLNKDPLLWTEEEKRAWDQYAREVAAKAEYMQRNYPYVFCLIQTEYPSGLAYMSYPCRIG